MNTNLETMLYDANCEIERLQALNARLWDVLGHSKGRFLNINIALSSGGTKREAIMIAVLGEDCIKMAFDREGVDPSVVRVYQATSS